MKQCIKCNEIKELSLFYKDRTEKDRLNKRCKSCIALVQKKHYYKDPKRRTDIKRKFEIRRKYGITKEQYDEMVIQQNNLCKICNKPEKDPHKKNLSIDHDHKTGKIRGLLCNYCNRGLGLFKDDPDILEQAVAYLRISSEDQRSRLKSD